MHKESDIVYEGKHFFVLKNKGKFDVCKNGVTCASLVGSSDSEEKAIRCAKRLELYPNNVK